MFGKLFNKIKYLLICGLAVVAISSCGPTDDPGKEAGDGYFISLGMNDLSLVLDTTQRLEYDFINRKTWESDYPDDDTVSFVSSNPEVASVSSSGLVTALSRGETDITVTMVSNGSKDVCHVTVGDPIDYVSQLTLDMSSPTKKAEVTTYLHVDGDTTHFNIDPSYGYEPAVETGILKARYLAVDTPESTGKIEPWGKKASNFTKERVTNAKSIIIESDDENWNLDSTGGRALLWIWYKLEGQTEYRNLNLELLQNGLSKQKNTLSTRYGEICTKAFNQAKSQKLFVHAPSSVKDPDFYYGSYKRVTIKDLRTNCNFYKNTLVCFDATVARVMGETIYVEDYNPQDRIVYGMQLFLGYTQIGQIREMCSNGNRIQIAGSFQYYEAGGTYQVSDPMFNLFTTGEDYDTYKLIALAEDNTDQDTVVQYPVMTIAQIKSKVTLNVTEYVEVEPGEFEEQKGDKQYDLGALMTAASAQIKGLTITDVYTTASGNSKGALSLTCGDSSGNTFTVRTEVIYDNDGNLVTAADLINKRVDVKGVIDYYEGNYQLRVLSYNDITILS